jgi:hypothetical protein
LRLEKCKTKKSKIFGELLGARKVRLGNSWDYKWEVYARNDKFWNL